MSHAEAPMNNISPAKEIIEEIRQGRMVVLVDDEHRENEGDLVLAAQFATAEHVNFMAKYGRGLICLTLTESRCDQLNLSKMVQKMVHAWAPTLPYQLKQLKA